MSPSSRRLLATLLLWPLAAGTVAAAPDPETGLTFTSGNRRVALIELFTSQGCSSCPPAERWLSGLKRDRGLWRDFVPAAFHVDYWDHLGWRDTLADPAYSARQRHYRDDGRIGTVYTPGFVVDGREWRGWFSGRARPAVATRGGELTVRVAEAEVAAEYRPLAGAPGELTLNLILLGGELSQAVAAGENAGRELVQDFSVLQWHHAGAADGHWRVPLPGLRDEPRATALAAWVSRPGDPAPLQATGGWLRGAGR